MLCLLTAQFFNICSIFVEYWTSADVGLWKRALPRPVTTLIRATVGSGLSPRKVESVALEPKSKLGKTKGAEKEDIESESKGNSINKFEGYNDVELSDLMKYMLENSSLLSYGARRVRIDAVYHQSKANEARIKESNLDNRKVGKFLERKRSFLSNTFELNT